MKLMKTAGLMVAAFGLVAVMSGEARAQAPTLTASANGVTVTIEWTALAGATSYTLGVGSSAGSSNIASVNLPTFVTRIVVNAPLGTYFMRVRGNLGTVAGPNSNEATVTVGAAPPPPGPGPCAAPAAPVVTAAVAGGAVTLSWPAVAGATSYTIQWSRAPGGTELQEQTTGVSRSSPRPGRHVLRPRRGQQRLRQRDVGGGQLHDLEPGESECAAHAESARRPIIPRSSLSYLQGVVSQVASQYRGDLLNSCRRPHVHVSRACTRSGRSTAVGASNYKRGHAGWLSMTSWRTTRLPVRTRALRRSTIYDIIRVTAAGIPATDWMRRHRRHAGRRRRPSICGNQFCARWTLDPYLRAGFPGSEGT